MTDPAGVVAASPGRRVSAWAAVAALVVAAVVGSDVAGVREQIVGSALPEPVRPATSRVAAAPAGEAPPPRTQLRSAPWWQTVAAVEGEAGEAAVPVTIAGAAVDWRVSWSCDAGHLEVRAAGRATPIVDEDCGEGVGIGRGTGATRLEVTADGPWSLEVAQRVDAPLVEQPLPAMTAAGTAVVATGTFRKAEGVGTGRVTLYETPREYFVRLEDFWVTPKSSLQLRLSEAEAPHDAERYLAAPSQLLATLDVTAGSLNFRVPAGVDHAGSRSVVVWSPTDQRVLATARLEGAS